MRILKKELTHKVKVVVGFNHALAKEALYSIGGKTEEAVPESWIDNLRQIQEGHGHYAVLGERYLFSDDPEIGLGYDYEEQEITFPS